MPRTTQKQIDQRPGEWHVLSPELTGREAIAVVVHEEWRGETQAKVKRLLPTTN